MYVVFILNNVDGMTDGCLSSVVLAWDLVYSDAPSLWCCTCDVCVSMLVTVDALIAHHYTYVQDACSISVECSGWPFVALVDHLLLWLTLCCSGWPFVALVDPLLLWLTLCCSGWPFVDLVDPLWPMFIICLCCSLRLSILLFSLISKDRGRGLRTDWVALSPRLVLLNFLIIIILILLRTIIILNSVV